MADDRRSFIKRFGVTLGSLIVSGSLPGCGPKKDAGLSGTESRIKGQAAASPIPRGPEWEAPRQCWLNLKNERNRHTLVEEFLEAQRQSKDPYTLRRDALAQEHQAILSVLKARDQLEKPVAEHMQMAFVEAAPDFCLPCRLRDKCRGGCKAAAEACYGSLNAAEPFLRRNIAQARPIPRDS